MRDRNRWMIQGAISGLVFATFAMIAGFLVDWPATDVLSAGVIAFCGGTALEHFMRRRYGVAWIFIVAGVGMGFFMMQADTKLENSVKDATAAVGSGGQAPTETPPGETGQAASTTKPKKEERKPAPADAATKPPVRTVVQVHNPNGIAVSLTYEYVGGSVPLGSLGPQATASFEVPASAPVELGTFAATSGGHTVRARVLLRRGQTHQVDLPFIDNP